MSCERSPVSPGSFLFVLVPLKRLQIDSPRRRERHPFVGQQQSLQIGGSGVCTLAHASARVDDAVPRNATSLRQRSQRMPDLPCMVGESGDRRDLAVCRHLAAGDAPNDGVVAGVTILLHAVSFVAGWLASGLHLKLATMRCLFVALALVVPASVFAHEFWIEPSRFRSAPGEQVAVHVLVGDAGAGQREEMTRRSDHLLRFEAYGAAGASTIVGLFGRAPVGLLSPEVSGDLVLAYQSRHTFIELPAETFESYLAEEGLSRVVEERVRAGETLAPGRESYARFAKSVLHVAGAREEGRSGARTIFDLEIGLPIEVIPETDPLTWQEGDPFALRVLYDGRPLADQQIKLIHLVDHELKILARTNAKGRVRWKPPQPGPWLVATVYMRRAPERLKGDWESFWGSLSFHLPDEAHGSER